MTKQKTGSVALFTGGLAACRASRQPDTNKASNYKE